MTYLQQPVLLAHVGKHRVVLAQRARCAALLRHCCLCGLLRVPQLADQVGLRRVHQLPPPLRRLQPLVQPLDLAAAGAQLLGHLVRARLCREQVGK